MRELHADQVSAGAKQLGGSGRGGGGVIDMVQDAGEENAVKGPPVPVPMRELGYLIRQGASLMAEGVLRRGTLSQRHRLLINVNAGDIMAGPGQLQGDVAQTWTDV